MDINGWVWMILGDNIMKLMGMDVFEWKYIEINECPGLPHYKLAKVD